MRSVLRASDADNLSLVPYVLIATDSQDLANEITSVLPENEFEVDLLSRGPDVTKAAKRKTPDLVVLDMQIGNMGGMAICLDLRLEASGNRLPSMPVLLLLDRRADVFLARRAEAQGWLIKPLDPIRLRRATQALLDGKTYEDVSYAPNPVVV